MSICANALDMSMMVKFLPSSESIVAVMKKDSVYNTRHETSVLSAELLINISFLFQKKMTLKGLENISTSKFSISKDLNTDLE